ncbi:MAG TPA: alpha-N-arabinofuranosidase [Roseiflexaceae bacterium]|nr:alpha-N-arabinofuranosidase [Roseiflexaceae bacterium]
MNQITINADLGKASISRHIYGHFAEHLGRCIYGGFWVGEDSPIPNTRGIRDDVIAALRAVRVPNLRWPGGCFADEYHWMDGIGPREQRPTMINTHWGGVTENNHFGTHEFLDLCEQLGCEPYICGNVGSGTVQEMQQWVEYLTFDGRSPMADLRAQHGHAAPWSVKYWGVGNENWGCGGNMTAEYYADEYRRYQTYVRNFGGNQIYKIACGPRNDDYHWTDVLMQNSRNMRGNFLMHGLSLHYYTPDGPFRQQHSATQFGEREWIDILKTSTYMDELITRHSAIMDRYDPEKRVGLVVDEWGTWYAAEPGTNPRFLYQQNSLRDALVTALTFNIFNRHCERVSMANIAQTINVLQALLLTEPDGAGLILTPTYHVFEMFSVHHDATLLPLELSCGMYAYDDFAMPSLSASASRDSNGRVHVSLCNVDPHQSAEVSCEVRGMALSAASGRVLTADHMQAYNSFEAPEQVRPTEFQSPTIRDNHVTCTLPPMSVAVLELT